MALQALTGMDFTEKNITELLGTSPEIGSPLKLFKENFNQISKEITKKTNLKLEWIVNQNGSFDQLKTFLSEKYILILNHKKITRGSHWAILRSINDYDITLVNPELGPEKTYSLNEFDWRGGIKVPTTQAYVAIRLMN